MPKETQKTAKSTDKKSKGFTADEKAAMKERAKELKEESEKADGESAVLAKIAEMTGKDRIIGEKLHAIIKANAPTLTAKLWYGQPAYARDGNVVCFFQSSQKFNTRYSTLGFNEEASLDEGNFWPTAFAIKDLNAEDEAKISALVKKAVR